MGAHHSHPRLVRGELHRVVDGRAVEYPLQRVYICSLLRGNVFEPERRPGNANVLVLSWSGVRGDGLMVSARMGQQWDRSTSHLLRNTQAGCLFRMAISQAPSHALYRSFACRYCFEPVHTEWLATHNHTTIATNTNTLSASISPSQLALQSHRNPPDMKRYHTPCISGCFT